MTLSTRKKTKFIHEGPYVAEVDVEVIVEENEWAPYLSLEDAYKLDDMREALRRGDLQTAMKHARVYVLQPVDLSAS